MRRLILSILASTLWACASAPHKAPSSVVDLGPARTAVDDARKSGAEQEPSFNRAASNLKTAESLVSQGDAASMDRAACLSDLIREQTRCAVDSMGRPRGAATGGETSSPETESLKARLQKATDEQRRLEERVGVLQRDLDVTETEIIRTKARLKGTETEAEVSSAIAEARILISRAGGDKARSAAVARCKESLAKAEQQFEQRNLGAALFFAMEAQENAVRLEGPESPSARKSFVVKAGLANLRKGPSTNDPITAQVPGGTPLEAKQVQGDWVEVEYKGVVGWILRSLLE